MNDTLNLNSMSGPSLPIDMPDAIATADDEIRDIVVRNDSRTRPSTTASITLLTPWLGAFRQRAIMPATKAPASRL